MKYRYVNFCGSAKRAFVPAILKRHEPTIDRWLTAMEESGDPWWQAAEHAADCLVASRELDRRWDGFPVSYFFFGDLVTGHLTRDEVTEA